MRRKETGKKVAKSKPPKSKKSRFKFKQSKFVIPILILISSISVGITAIRHRVDVGIDSISYLSIAQQYADRNFSEAINAYWSPLISWFMAPFVMIGLEPRVAFAVVNTLISLAILIVGAKLIAKYTKNSILMQILFILTMTPFLHATAIVKQPDLLVVLWTICFTWMIINVDHLMFSAKNKKNLFLKVFALGVMGGIGYLTKLFLLPYFFSVFIIWILFRICTAQRSRSSVNTDIKFYSKIIGFGLSGFLLIALPWIILLSIKYERPVVGSSFAVSILSRFDESLINTDDYLPKPPNQYAVAYGEDRTPRKGEAGLNRNEAKSTFSSAEVKKQINERVKAAPYFVNKVNSMSPFIIITFVVLGILIMYNSITYARSQHLYIFLLTFWTYFVGYALITRASSAGGNVRYYWPLFGLFSIVLPIMLFRYKDAFKRIKGVRRFSVVFLTLLVPFISFSDHMLGFSYAYSIPVANPARLVESIRGRTISPLSKVDISPTTRFALRVKDDPEGVIKKGDKLVGNNFRQTYFIAYYSQAQVYGKTERDYDYNNQDFLELMQANGIDYFLKYTPSTIYDPANRTQLERDNIVIQYVDDIRCGDTRSTPLEKCVVEVYSVPIPK